MVAAQLGDILETVIRNYVKPEMMSQADIDDAFTAFGSRQGPAKVHEMHDFGPFGHTAQDPLNAKKAL